MSLGFGRIAFHGVAGTALGTDADPNTTAPVETRKFQVTRSGEMLSGIALYAMPTGGTICSVALWVLDTNIGRWLRMTAATACATDLLTKIGPVSPGVDHFVQVTANTGVEVLGVGVFGV